MSKKEHVKIIYVCEEGSDSYYESLQELTEEGIEDGVEVLVYELKSVKKLKTKVELV